MFDCSIARKVQEHTDLCKVLSDAMERAKQAENSGEFWDAWSEAEIIQEEIADTELEIGGESVGIWS